MKAAGFRLAQANRPGQAAFAYRFKSLDAMAGCRYRYYDIGSDTLLQALSINGPYSWCDVPLLEKGAGQLLAGVETHHGHRPLFAARVPDALIALLRQRP